MRKPLSMSVLAYNYNAGQIQWYKSSTMQEVILTNVRCMTWSLLIIWQSSMVISLSHIATEIYLVKNANQFCDVMIYTSTESGHTMYTCDRAVWMTLCDVAIRIGGTKCQNQCRVTHSHCASLSQSCYSIVFSYYAFMASNQKWSHSTRLYSIEPNNALR